MADNLSVKITADVADLQAKLAIAKAQYSALISELNKGAREAANNGLSDKLSPDLLRVAEAATAAQAKMKSLRAELKAAGADALHTHGPLGDLTQMFGVAREAAGMFGVALSAGAIVEFGKQALENAASIQEEADMLGISTTALQAYQYAARDSGVATDQADMFLRRFIANLGAAEESGAGPAAKAIERLGLTVDQLAADPSNAVYVFAAALERIKDPAERARIEMELGGRAGQDVNAMLDKLAPGYDAVATAARNAGQMLDPGTNAAAAQAKIDLNELGTVVENVATNSLVSLINEGKLAGLTLEGLGSIALATIDKLSSIKDTTFPRVDRYAAGSDGPEGFGTPQSWMAKPTAPNIAPPQIQTTEEVSRAAELARRIADVQIEGAQRVRELRVEAAERTNETLYNLGQKSLDDMLAQATKLENDRYQIELDGLKNRIKADQGDKAALAKDNSDMEVMEQEHKNRLSQIDDQGQEKRRQQQQADLQDAIKASTDKLQVDTSAVEAAYKAHQIGIADREKLELSLTAATEKDVLSRLDAEIKGLAAGTEAYALAMKQRRELVDQFAKDTQRIIDTAADESAQKWQKAWGSITQSVNSAFEGMMTRQEKFGVAADKLLGDLLRKGIMSVAGGVEDRLGNALGGALNGALGVNLSIGGTGAGDGKQNLLETNIQSLTLATLRQTTAAIAGATALTSNTTSQATNVVANTVQTDSNTLAVTANTTALTAAASASGGSGLESLIVGAASIFGLGGIVQGFFGGSGGSGGSSGASAGKLPSFAVGAWDLPRSMIAEVHKGEMIVPAGPAEAFRSGTGFGGGDTHIHVHHHINAVDGESVRRLVNHPTHARNIAESVAAQFDKHPNLRPKY